MITNVYQFAKIAAMAPPVPGWFKPSLQGPPKKVLSYNDWKRTLTEEDSKYLDRYFDDIDGTWHDELENAYDHKGDKAQDLRSRVDQHIKSIFATETAMEEWTQYRDEETLFQWQVYYGDKIIERSQLFLDRLK